MFVFKGKNKRNLSTQNGIAIIQIKLKLINKNKINYKDKNDSFQLKEKIFLKYQNKKE